MQHSKLHFSQAKLSFNCSKLPLKYAKVHFYISEELHLYCARGGLNLKFSKARLNYDKARLNYSKVYLNKTKLLLIALKLTKNKTNIYYCSY